LILLWSFCPGKDKQMEMKAALLDRDGVLNELVYHENVGIIDAPFHASQFKLLPRVPQAIRLLNDLGLKVAVVSNQPGIAKGHLRLEVLKHFERALLTETRKVGGRIDRIYYCFHHPEAKITKYRKHCLCRKPEAGMLEQASQELGVRPDECYMIGDGIPDLQAGKRVGCRTVFIGRWKCEICQFTDAPSIRPALVARDLWEASQLIRAEVTGSPLMVPSASPSLCPREQPI
jgi:D-glycero-D-manno-heptose 1,7-bisphosphate phosphatase